MVDYVVELAETLLPKQCLAETYRFADGRLCGRDYMLYLITIYVCIDF